MTEQPQQSSADAPPKQPNRRIATVSDNLSTSLSTAGIGEVFIWACKCIEAHKLLTPDDNVALICAAFLFPMFLGLRNAILRRLPNAT